MSDNETTQTPQPEPVEITLLEFDPQVSLILSGERVWMSRESLAIILRTRTEIVKERDLYLQQRKQLMEAAEEESDAINSGNATRASQALMKLRAAINAIKDKELEQPSEDGE